MLTLGHSPAGASFDAALLLSDNPTRESPQAQKVFLQPRGASYTTEWARQVWAGACAARERCAATRWAASVHGAVEATTAWGQNSRLSSSYSAVIDWAALRTLSASSGGPITVALSW